MTSNSYDKGSDRERELMKLLETEDYAVVRSAGSGTGGLKYNGEQREQPDVIAGNGNRLLAMESKSCGGKVLYIKKDNWEDLTIFAEQFGAEPYIAVRFDAKDFFFFKREDFHETSKSLRIKKEKLEEKGMKLDEIINNND